MTKTKAELEAKNAKLKAENKKWQKDYFDMVAAFGGTDVDSMAKEIAKLRRSRDKLAENLAEMGNKPKKSKWQIIRDENGEFINVFIGKAEAIKSWIEWSEK